MPTNLFTADIIMTARDGKQRNRTNHSPPKRMDSPKYSIGILRPDRRWAQWSRSEASCLFALRGSDAELRQPDDSTSPCIGTIEECESSGRSAWERAAVIVDVYNPSDEDSPVESPWAHLVADNAIPPPQPSKPRRVKGMPDGEHGPYPRMSWIEREQDFYYPKKPDNELFTNARVLHITRDTNYWQERGSKLAIPSQNTTGARLAEVDNAVHGAYALGHQSGCGNKLCDIDRYSYYPECEKLCGHEQLHRARVELLIPSYNYRPLVFHT